METTVKTQRKSSKASEVKNWCLAEVKERYVRHEDKTIEEMPSIKSSQDAYQLLTKIWDNETLELQESFYVLYVNRRNKVICWSLISIGGVAGTVADPKLIFRRALLVGASGIILSHNHPSGNMHPSQADIDLTKKIKEGARLLEIMLLDHVILAPPKKYYSFADEGLL